MFNAWDIVFLLLALASAWLGWRLKSLPLLGLGFSIAIAPLAARSWSPALGALMVDSLGGAGLKPHQDELAWWLIAVLCFALLIWLFRVFSGMLAALKLELLDRAFGALLLGLAFAALLSLNLDRLRLKLDGAPKKSLGKSWAWSHLRSKNAPAWLQDMEEKFRA